MISWVVHACHSGVAGRDDAERRVARRTVGLEQAACRDPPRLGRVGRCQTLSTWITLDDPPAFGLGEDQERVVAGARGVKSALARERTGLGNDVKEDSHCDLELIFPLWEVRVDAQREARLPSSPNTCDAHARPSYALLCPAGTWATLGWVILWASRAASGTPASADWKQDCWLVESSIPRVRGHGRMWVLRCGRAWRADSAGRFRSGRGRLGRRRGQLGRLLVLRNRDRRLNVSL